MTRTLILKYGAGIGIPHSEMPEENPDQRVARALGMNPDQVGHIRNEWNDSPNAVVIRQVIADQLQQHIIECERKLRSCTQYDLPNLQGSLSAFEQSISTVIGRL